MKNFFFVVAVTGLLVGSGNAAEINRTSSDLSVDASPQLGGDLDLNGNDITGTGEINITGSITASKSLNAGDGVTAGSGTFTATGASQYAASFSTGIFVSTGTVGIGTETPASILEIYATNTQANVDLSGFYSAIVLHGQSPAIHLDGTGSNDGFAFILVTSGGDTDLQYEGGKEFAIASCTGPDNTCTDVMNVDAARDWVIGGTFSANDSNTGTHFFRANNTNTGSGAIAEVSAQVASSAAGDPCLRLIIGGVISWYACPDNSLGDEFTIGSGGNFPTGGTDHLRITTGGMFRFSPDSVNTSTMTATGSLELNEDLRVPGDAFVGGNFVTTGTASVGALTVLPDTVNTSTFPSGGSLNLSGDLNATASINSTTGITATSSTLTTELSVSGDAVVEGTFTSSGAVKIGGETNFNPDTVNTSTIGTNGRWTQRQETDCEGATPDAVGQLCNEDEAASPMHVATSTLIGGFVPIVLAEVTEPFGGVHISTSNAADTSIVTDGVFVKAAGTSVAGPSNLMTGSTSNRITSNALETHEFHCTAAISFTSSGTNETLHFRIVKNADITESEDHSFPVFIATGSDIRNMMISRDVELATNDFVEVFIANVGATNNVQIEAYEFFCAGL